MDDKKLFLLDAYALIYRAYYALIRAPRVTSKGLNTSAIFGFCNTIEEILKKECPTHIAVCFDPEGGHTFRHDKYPLYKAQREAQPEDITLSIPYIKDIIRAYNIPVIEKEGFEADDIIGTLSRMAEREGFTTYMMTPDKDYGQLVTDHVLMYRPSLKGKGFEIRGVKEICERYGINRPEQVIDLLALEGDASDNIPGCPGIGEKTAVKLIGEWGSVENLIENTSKLKGAVRIKVSDNADQIMLSKDLATIRTDVPVEIDFEQLRLQPEDTERLREIYSELEFKSFIARLDTPAQPSVPEKAAPTLFDFMEEQPSDLKAAPENIAPFNVLKIHDLKKAEDIIKRAACNSEIGFAPYVTGDEIMRAKLNGFAIAIDLTEVYYFPLPSDSDTRAEWLKILTPLFTSSRTTVVSHDVKRDYIILKNNGIPYTAEYYDTSVAHYLLQPEMRHRLADVAYSILGYQTMDCMEDNRSRKPYPEYREHEVHARIGEQAAIVLSLRHAIDSQLKEGGLTELLDQIELPFVTVLAEMERTGVRIDVGELNRLSSQLTARVDTIRERIFDLAGKPFNISSPKQVGEILFNDLKIDPNAKRTKKGSFSTTEEILEKFRHSHEIVDLILKVRGLSKLLTTYINALPGLINPTTGKIHTTYNQTVTATGRISSTNPNLQNIPVRTDDGREIRRAFIPDDGDLFLSADYSQIELRLMADMSGDPDMIEAFRSGEDIHRATAAKIYKIPISEVTDDQRRHAKTANFGIMYGISAFGLSERLGIPRNEAKKLISGYFESYPHIKEYIEGAIEKARLKGYVTTIMGRKRFLPDINSRNAVVRSYAERNAVNAPLQGSAADIIKIAMIRIAGEINRLGMKSRMIMQVHDELIFNVSPDEITQLQEIVIREMTDAYHGKVGLEVASGIAKNWLEAH